MVFLLLAAAAASWVAHVPWWPLSVGLGWLAVSLLLVATAYLATCPRLLMKNRRGSLSLASWVLLGPFHLLNTLIFGGYRRFSREPAWNEVIPRLYLGRRLWEKEARALGAMPVLDLTCELPENRVMRRSAGYCCLPVLDNGCPTPHQLREGVAWLAENFKHGPVYVHCAAGHGRSAMLVIAYLLHEGIVGSVDEGIAFLKSKRPRVHVNHGQRAALKAFATQDKRGRA